MTEATAIVPQHLVLVLPSTGEFDSRTYRIATTCIARGHSEEDRGADSQRCDPDVQGARHRGLLSLQKAITADVVTTSSGMLGRPPYSPL